MSDVGKKGPGGNAKAEPGLFPAPPLAEQERMVEAMLFASADPLSLRDLAGRMPPGCAPAEALALLARRYEGRGVELRRVGEAWAFRTAPDLASLLRQEVEETRKLSRAATETLAIVAYHQPVTRAEIEEIRGVSVSRGTLDQLIALDWIRFGRRRETPGRPVTFVVTEGFLDHFSLQSVRDLPGLRDLKEAGLLEARPSPEADPDSDDDDESESLFDHGEGDDADDSEDGEKSS